MIDRLTDLYNQYYSHFMMWYNAASDYTQIAVMLASGVVVLIIMSMIFLSRVTR